MRAGRIVYFAIAALVLAPVAVPSLADVAPAVFPAESRATTSRLGDARKLLDDKKWSEAIDELQAILDAGGADLVAVTPRYSVPARRQCHLLLARLPAEQLIAYRTRMEPQARKWLDQGRANRDERLLRKVADEAFCTRAGESALDTLGDLAFERGRFEEAEHWWRLLAPPPDGDAGAFDPKKDLIYPDPQGGPARVQAKQVLARVFRDPHADWSTLLAKYRERNKDAEGTLAGRKGKYADLLAEIARQIKTNAVAEAGWSTYGGDSTRGRVLPAQQPQFFDRLERACRRGPTWRFDLEHGLKGDAPKQIDAAKPTDLSRSLLFHPLIVGDYAVVSDALRVTAYDLRTGSQAIWYEASDTAPDLRLPVSKELLDLRYTLTAADDCLYARLGAQYVFHPDEVDKNAPNRALKEKMRDQATASVLACLSVKPDAKGGHLRWALRPVIWPGRASQNGAIFEGAPVVHQGQLYVAATYFENDRTVTAVVCYPAGTEKEPSPRWTQVVCETQELRGREKRARHHLLTVAGPNVVYCSHSGAIAALDTLTGKPAWALRYPSRGAHEDPTQPVVRDLTPPLYADGRLYVAPTDYDHLLCLDPLTGQTIWDRERLEPTHLLGVGQGKLIFTTLHGLRAVAAADGSDTGGWQLPDGGGERAPAGRGLLIGDQVLWPTANGVIVCGQRDGTLDYRPTLGSQVPLGNIAYGNGCLAVADRTTLSLFVPDGVVIDQRKDQTRRKPVDPAAWLDLGRAQVDVGQLENAKESLQKARGLLAPSERRLRDDLRRETLHVLLTQAQRAAKKGIFTVADVAVTEATNTDQPPRARLEALVQAARMWEEVGQPARAVAVWQSILATETLRGQSAFGWSRTQLAAGDYAAERIAHLEKRQVAEVRPVVERQVRTAEDVPDLPLPLSRQWQITLAADEHLLPVAGLDELLVTGRPGLLTARSVDTGKPRWNRRLAFAPQWVARNADTLVAAGPDGAACLRQDDGSAIWEVASPILFAGRRPETLASFQLANGRLVFLAGKQWLFALNAETGATLWNQVAPGAGLELSPPSGRFNPALVAHGNAILVQPTPSRTVVLDAATGRTLRSLTFASGIWWPPTILRENDALCFTPTARTILQIDGKTGATAWEHSLTAATTLTGEPPQLAGRKDTLLALIPTNLGDQLQRLDPATGKPLWAQPPLLASKHRPVQTAGWALDEDTVYFEQGRRLYARSLTDGKLLWDKPLAGPDAPYHTRRLRDYLLTYPAETGSWRFQCRFLWGSVQWERKASRDDGAGFGFPLVCSDPKTGQVIQRLNLSPTPPRVALRVRPSTRFTMQLKVEIGPAEAIGDNPVVQATPRGLVVAVGDQVWRFRAAGKDKQKSEIRNPKSEKMQMWISDFGFRISDFGFFF